MKTLRPTLTALVLAILLSGNARAARLRTATIQIVETTDVHGCFFPWDFIAGKPAKGSLARVAALVSKMRSDNPDGVILLDNGDLLQGQPVCYYYNYLRTEKTNIGAQCLNFMQYDAVTWGNHDVETGHPCYDRWISQTRAAVLGANVIDVATGKPYVRPYTVVERNGVKVAVIGLLTPAIPCWLEEKLWSGLSFAGMKETARKWVDYVKTHEKPDIIVGLFHAGLDGGIRNDRYAENQTLEIAREIPGFDVIMFGHDHIAHNSKVTCADGKEVLLLNASNNARNVAVADISVTKKGGRVIAVSANGRIMPTDSCQPDETFMRHFEDEMEEVKRWTATPIGKSTKTVSSHDSFFGPAAFTDLIHNLQLQLSGADISFSAPLTFDATIREGDITVADMFKLCKYENSIYVIRMTGEEIRKYLEMSYSLWTNTMLSPDDHIMKLRSDSRAGHERTVFLNQTYNFDSAAGIDYLVDVTKPEGHKVKILRMTGGLPFDERKTYLVALNSYRANGGGELLEKGAGIRKQDLESRIVQKTGRDLRRDLIDEIKRLKTIDPQPNNNWRFVPDEWTVPAVRRDRKLIFNE